MALKIQIGLMQEQTFGSRLSFVKNNIKIGQVDWHIYPNTIFLAKVNYSCKTLSAQLQLYIKMSSVCSLVVCHSWLVTHAKPNHKLSCSTNEPFHQHPISTLEKKGKDTHPVVLWLVVSMFVSCWIKFKHYHGSFLSNVPVPLLAP